MSDVQPAPAEDPVLATIRWVGLTACATIIAAARSAAALTGDAPAPSSGPHAACGAGPAAPGAVRRTNVRVIPASHCAQQKRGYPNNAQSLHAASISDPRV